MKYAVFLRGINVGGHNIIKMADLREVLSKNGFTSVKTYIQSGNVVLESEVTDRGELEGNIEAVLSSAFGYQATVMILSQTELEHVIEQAPKAWQHPEKLRCYIGYIKQPTTTAEIMTQVKINPEVDAVAAGPQAIYMTTQVDGLTRSRFTKMVGTAMYKLLTIRNFATSRKMLELMKAAD